jgi:hypothetical protein
MVQILPIQVRALDQFQFSPSFPFFQTLLPRNSRFHVLVQFVPNQLVDTVVLGESFYNVVAVFPYPLDEA